MSKKDRQAVKRSERALGTVLYVPNDPDGAAFLKQFRKYLNRGVYKMHVNGRNPDRTQFKKIGGYYHQRIPLEHSTYFAVYIDIKEKTLSRAKVRLAEASWLAVEAEGKLRTAQIRRDALRALPPEPKPKPLPMLFAARLKRAIELESK